jgi:hypothetical protein
MKLVKNIISHKEEIEIGFNLVRKYQNYLVVYCFVFCNLWDLDFFIKLGLNEADTLKSSSLLIY